MNTPTTELSVFIHSTGMGPSMWARVPAAVIGGTRKVTPTNIGYPSGASITWGEPCGVEREVDHLLDVIGPNARGVHLYGHSYGAVAALRVARRLGPRARSLFLFEPPLFGALAAETRAHPDAHEEVSRFEASPWFLTDDARGGTDEWLEMFIDYWNRAGAWNRMPPPMKSEMRALGWKMFQEVRACFLELTADGDAEIPNLPCTLVTAERSPNAARAMMAALVAKTPHAHAVTLPGVGHMTFLMKPHLLYQAMQAHARRAGVVALSQPDMSV